LQEGSDVHLKFAQDVSSKTAADDDPVALVLDQDLKVGDAVVVKAGAKAVGTITHAKKAGMLGKAGELNMRLEYLLAGGTPAAAAWIKRQRGRRQSRRYRCTDGFVRAHWLDQARKER